MNGPMRAVVYSILCLIVSGCVGSECGNKLLSEATSPNNEYVATVFSHDCGATTAVAIVVSIRAAGSEFNGNEAEGYVFTMQGDHEVHLQWSSPNRLVIRRPPIASDVFMDVKKWKGVQVVTEP